MPASVDPRPSFMDEYAAATGNSLGGLDEYWEVIRAHPRTIGGAVWDWVSPGIRATWRVTPDASPHGNDGALMGTGPLRRRPGRSGRRSRSAATTSGSSSTATRASTSPATS